MRYSVVGMAVLAAVYYIGQVRFAPKYSHDHMKEYERLDTEVKGAHAHALELAAPPTTDPYPAEREQAVNDYSEAANEAAAVVVNDVAYRRNFVGLYLSLLAQYRAAYGIARDTSSTRQRTRQFSPQNSGY